MFTTAHRVAWSLAWHVLYRLSPEPLHGWRRGLLRMFGARIGRSAHPYPSARIWAPWNLIMEEGACLGPGVDCYNVAQVVIGNRATVSQRAFLCTATHDIDSTNFGLVAVPIVVGAGAWIAAEAFVGPGVVVGEGAVIGARAVVTRDVEPMAVVVGNPARKVREREGFTS